jgi:hypothetical protein
LGIRGRDLRLMVVSILKSPDKMLSRRVRMLTRVRPAGAPVYHHVKTCIPVRGVRTSPRAWFKPRTDGEGRFFKAIMDVGPRQATIETDVPAITVSTYCFPSVDYSARFAYFGPEQGTGLGGYT